MSRRRLFREPSPRRLSPLAGVSADSHRLLSMMLICRPFGRQRLGSAQLQATGGRLPIHRGTDQDDAREIWQKTAVAWQAKGTDD